MLFSGSVGGRSLVNEGRDVFVRRILGVRSFAVVLDVVLF